MKMISQFQTIQRQELRQIKGGGKAAAFPGCEATCVKLCRSTPEIWCKCINGTCVQQPSWPDPEYPR